MSKNLKIYLAVLALISIVISLGIFLDGGFGFVKLKQIVKNSINNTSKDKIIEAPTPTPKEIFLTLPVERKYFDNFSTSLVKGRNDNLFLALFLDKGAEIKSVFNGKVLSVDNFRKGEGPFPDELDFSQIFIENEDGNLRAG